MTLPAPEAQPPGGSQLRFLLFLLLLLLLMSWPSPGDALALSEQPRSHPESQLDAHELRGRFQELLSRLHANRSQEAERAELIRSPAVRVLTPEGAWCRGPREAPPAPASVSPAVKGEKVLSLLGWPQPCVRRDGQPVPRPERSGSLARAHSARVGWSGALKGRGGDDGRWEPQGKNPQELNRESDAIAAVTSGSRRAGREEDPGRLLSRTAPVAHGRLRQEACHGSRPAGAA